MKEIRDVLEVLEVAVDGWGGNEGQLTETEMQRAHALIARLRKERWQSEVDSAAQAEAQVAADWMAQLQRRALTDCVAWDELAKSLGVDLDAPRWTLAGTRAVGWPRPMGPSRKARPRCESGGRDYCSCDVCF